MANTRRIMAVLVYTLVVAALPVISDIPFRVWAADAASFAVAFLFPALVAARREWKPALGWMLGGGLAGALLLDILSSIIIVKRDFLMLWYIFYPLVLTVLIGLHAVIRWMAADYRRRRGYSAG